MSVRRTVQIPTLLQRCSVTQVQSLYALAYGIASENTVAVSLYHYDSITLVLSFGASCQWDLITFDFGAVMIPRWLSKSFTVIPKQAFLVRKHDLVCATTHFSSSHECEPILVTSPSSPGIITYDQQIV
jgi:hypothetical protein